MVGAVLGVAMHLSPGVRRALHPFVIGSQAVPVPVLAPLVILVLGFGLAPKVLLIALVCFFPITINLYDGLRGADPDARRLLRSLQATRWQSLRLVEAPAALPAAFTGLKVAAAVAVIGAVFAEWAGAERGLGRALITANGQLADRARVRRRAPALPAGHRPLRRLRAARAARGRLDATHRPRRTMTRRCSRSPLAVLARCSCLAGCGEKSEPAGAPAAATAQPLGVMLDYFPNADHAGIYAAQATGAYADAGLDVEITPPPDPSAAAQAAAGRQADIAISYEPELLLARDKGAELVSVGALVQTPLTSLMAVGKAASARREDLRGKRVGTAGIPYQTAYLKTILETAGVDPGIGQGDQRRLQPRARRCCRARSTRRSARSGTTRASTCERRGRDPQIQRMEELGVPTYSELVFVVRRRDLRPASSARRVRRFMQATARGHAALREDPQPGLDGLLAADPGLDRGLQEAVDQGDAAGVLPGGRGGAVRLPGPGRVAGLRRLDARATGSSGSDQNAEQVLTNEFLAGEGLDPRDALEQD